MEQGHQQAALPSTAKQLPALPHCTHCAPKEGWQNFIYVRCPFPVFSLLFDQLKAEALQKEKEELEAEVRRQKDFLESAKVRGGWVCMEDGEWMKGDAGCGMEVEKMAMKDWQ